MVSWWSWGLTDTSLLLMSDPCVSAATAMEAPVGPAYQTLELPQLSSRFASPLNLSRSVSLSCELCQDGVWCRSAVLSMLSLVFLHVSSETCGLW